jgi:hypothetical protein
MLFEENSLCQSVSPNACTKNILIPVILVYSNRLECLSLPLTYTIV